MSRSIAFRKALVTVGFVSLLVYAYARGHAAAEELRRDGTDPERAARIGYRLRDVTAGVGIDFRHAAPELDPRLDSVHPQIATTGASVAVIDVDADGDFDLYATTSRHGESNALYLNAGDGTFTDVAPAAGLADLNRNGEGCSMGSIWADVDADGDLDVLVYKWGRQQLLLQERPLEFRDVTSTSGLEELWVNCNNALFFDANRDGLVDLFLGGYYREDVNLWQLASTRIMQESFEFSRNGGRDHLLLNRGSGRFEDVSTAWGIGGNRWTYASTAADFDGDGWQDLYVANDYGAEELYLNRNGERFEPADVDLDRNSKSGMCASLGDVGNDGRLAVFVANISQPGYLFQGNNLRLNYVAERGTLEDGPEGPVRNCGWAWGSAFGDLDLDGWQDLVVVNGMISASRERDYWYNMAKVAGGNGALFEDALNWPPFEDMSLSGYERTRVLMNRRGRTFVEVGADAGISDTYDGRAVVLADLDGDGRRDMVVANQKGPLLVYRNEAVPGAEERHWIAFDLVATASNPDAAGAALTVRFGDQRQVAVVVLGGGFSSQGPRRLHFGLGTAAGIDGAQLSWPSGRTQEVGPHASGSVHRLVEAED